MSKVNDLTGKTFSRLTVKYRKGTNKNGRVVWHVKCECGNELDVLGNSLTMGNTLSCGCLQKEKAKDSMGKLHKKQWSDQKFIDFKKNDMKIRFTKHGARCRNNIDPLYDTWRAMKIRCKTLPSYKRKNILVCKEWNESFETFRIWALVNGYEKGKHLDRIDNTKNYEPNNCQFLIASEHYKKTGEEHRKKKEA